MCEKCFESEIHHFETAERFQTFEIELEGKLVENNGLFFLRTSSEGELIAYTIYACKNCKQKWFLQVPNTLNPGFFLKEKNAQNRLTKLKKNDDKGRYIVIGICLLIMFFCFVALTRYL